MQTTLLSLAIAIILALLAALVGPLLIDWGGYRSILEAEASDLIGVDVRVTGAIDARLLPSPRLTLHDVEVGSGGEKLRAKSLGIEFALGPLMRGEWRASEMQLAGPQVTLGLDASGRLQAPGIAVAFDPDALSIDRLSIVDGQITLANAANGSEITLDRLWFNGEARSLIGPVKGEGAVRIGGELYPFRLTAGRYNAEAGLKLHINIDPVNYPLSIESDGFLTLGNGEPQFDGTLSLARPVGIALRGTQVTQPWRINGKLKAGAQSALMEQVEFQYGSEEQGLKLTGVADFKFGKNPRFDGVLSSRQIDLDRVLAGTDGVRPLPAAAVRQLAELGGSVFRPTFPIQIGVGIDQVTLGGSSLQNLRGDISTDAGGWNLDRFEFRAPGFTQVRLSGHLAVAADGVAFTGPAEIDTTDPKALAAWLEGRSGPAQSEMRPLSLRGEVTLASEKVAVERLKAEFERKTVAGRMAYVFAAGNRVAKLDAELNAPELDIDAALAFGNALLAGSKIERPHDMTIAADIGRATVGGFVARNASARLKVDGGGLQIDRLSVADLGGAAFSASGRIVTAAPSPQGSIRVDLTAPDITPVLAVLTRFAPETAQALSAAAPAMAPAKLQARLTIDGAGPATQANGSLAKFGIDGSLGKVRVALNGEAKIDAIALSAGDIRFDGKLNADDGRLLVAMLGLDRVVTVAAGPGALTLNASGPLRGELRLDTRLTAGGLDANANGTARPFADTPTAAFSVAITRANAAPLGAASLSRPALPVAATARIALAGKEITIADILGNIGGTAVRGKLALTPPHRLQGDIEADNIDGAGLLAAAIGFPTAATSTDGSWVWSTEPFTDGAFADMTGQVAVKVRRVDLSERLTAREFRATLRLGNDELALDDIAGDVAGGRLTGQMSFRSADDGLKARAKLSLAGADAVSLVPAGARPPVTGALSVSVEVEGSGLSPVALFGSMRGSGEIGLADAQFAGLDPRAFDAVTRAVDMGLPVDAGRITNVVSRALDSGRLSVKRADGAIAVSAGQMRLTDVTAEAKDAALSITGNLDLTDGSIDARLVLSGSSEAAGSRPDIYMALKGPIAAPARSIDVSALNGWLTLRAVENQAKKLRAIEAARPEVVVTPGSAPPIMPAPIFMPAPKSDQAPALPAPIDISPLPAPAPAGRPAASVGPQN